jgi:hypothetical protein
MPSALLATSRQGFPSLRKVFGNIMILCRNPAGIHDKNNHVGLRHCLARLFGHLLVNATRGVRLESTRVDDDELVFTLFGIAIVPITRQSSKVGDDGVTGLLSCG